MWERRRWLHVTLNSPWNWLSNWYCLAAEREGQRGNEDASKHPAPSLHPPQPSLLLHPRLNLNPPSPPSFALNFVSLFFLQQLERPRLESSQLKQLEILGNFLLDNDFWGYHFGTELVHRFDKIGRSKNIIFGGRLVSWFQKVWFLDISMGSEGKNG